MQVVLVFVIVIAVVYILGRLGNHNNIKEVGGIRKNTTIYSPSSIISLILK